MNMTSISLEPVTLGDRTEFDLPIDPSMAHEPGPQRGYEYEGVPGLAITEAYDQTDDEGREYTGLHAIVHRETNRFLIATHTLDAAEFALSFLGAIGIDWTQHPDDLPTEENTMRVHMALLAAEAVQNTLDADLEGGVQA